MFTSTEQKIRDRLTAGLPEGTKVLQQSEMDEINELRQKAPFVAVVYDGYTPAAFIPPGLVQKIDQEWWVVIGTKSGRGNGKTIAARDAAGELAETVLELLLGFHLGGGSYLRLRESPGPEYEDGYCYLPIGFTSSATFKGTP